MISAIARVLCCSVIALVAQLLGAKLMHSCQFLRLTTTIALFVLCTCASLVWAFVRQPAGIVGLGCLAASALSASWLHVHIALPGCFNGRFPENRVGAWFDVGGFQMQPAHVVLPLVAIVIGALCWWLQQRFDKNHRSDGAIEAVLAATAWALFATLLFARYVLLSAEHYEYQLLIPMLIGLGPYALGGVFRRPLRGPWRRLVAMAPCVVAWLLVLRILDVFVLVHRDAGW